jgi:cell wall-associated NlpC family hydrolase
MAEIADQIVAAARQMLGTPFRHQGRVPGEALDCAGLAVLAASTAGLTVTDRRCYGREPDGQTLERSIDEQPCLVPIDTAYIAPGDLLLLRIKHDPQHLAIVASSQVEDDQLTMLHCCAASGRVVEHNITRNWYVRIVGAYRFVGIA